MALAVPEIETINLADGTTAKVSKVPGMSAEEWKDTKKFYEENPEEARKAEGLAKDHRSAKATLQNQALQDFYDTKMSSGDDVVSNRVLGLEKNPEFAHIFQAVKRGDMDAVWQHTYNEPLMLKVSRAVGGVPDEVKDAMAKIQSTPITLQEACKMGDMDQLQNYLKTTEGTGKQDLEATDAKGVTCLGYAIGANRTAIVKKLLENKADASKCDTSGANAVHYAAAYGRKELLTFLIDGKVDMNATNAAGLTPLALATKNKQKEAIDILKSKGGKL